MYFFFFRNNQKSDELYPLSKENQTQTHIKKEIIKKDEKTEIEPLLDIKLNNSDEKIRELLKNCSSEFEFTKWLKKEDLIRKFVAIVDNISKGTTPTPHLEFLKPSNKFKVIFESGKIKIDPICYKRYNIYSNVFTSLNTKALVLRFKQLKPLIDEAYKELGYPEEKFEEPLFEAFSILMNTPVVYGNIYLRKKIISFSFVDQNLEKLNAVQKHLLRMGPENIKQIHTKLKEIAKEMGFQLNQLPQPKTYIPNQN